MANWSAISLSKRLLISNLLVCILILPLFGLSLYQAFKSQANLSQAQALEAYSYNLLASSEIINGKLQVTDELDAPSFQLPDSGLYAIIRQQQNIVWHSDSFIAPTAPIKWQSSQVGVSQFNSIYFNGQAYFNWQLNVEFEQNGQIYPFTFHIIKHKLDYQTQLDRFFSSIWRWLLFIAIAFILIQSLWIIWFKRPLTQLNQEIEQIETRQRQQLSETYPIEINALSKNLNRLIKTEQQQRSRYKNTLADLAHSLKTPLAVIFSSKDLNPGIQPQLEQIKKIINHQLKRAQTNGHNNWHLGCEIEPVAQAIIASLKKIYQDKAIHFQLTIQSKSLFYGEESDLYELLGNLLDNACKACQSNVLLTVSQAPKLNICIADDGKGLSDTQLTEILKRGHRADTYEQGHGIGLAIVQDLANSYQAELKVSATSQLGGAQFELRFK